MTVIRGPLTTSQTLPTEMVQQADKSSTPKAPALPVDSTVRVSGTAQALTGTDLPSVVPPPAGSLESVSAAAQSFAYNLVDMGHSRQSSDAMMLAFLKLQILESSQANWNQMLSSTGRSTLRKGAIDDAAHSSQDAATAGQMQAEADQLYNRATADKDKADSIASDAGINPAELETLYNQSIAAGKNGSDVIDRYRAAHANDPDLAEKTAALEKAEPYYRSGATAYQDAEEISGNAGGLGSAWMLGAGMTQATRMGTAGMHAVLANAEAQQKLANDLMALLSGMRPDAKGREQGMLDAEQARVDLGKLILDLIDAHVTANAGARTSFR